MNTQTTKPLVVELFCGTFGWSDGFLDEGYRSIGFDIEHLPHHGPVPDGAELVLQDVLTLHGSQFKGAAVIVCSPPCQSYSYLAMPWSRSKDPNNSKAAKALRKKWETEGPDNRLFDACFRIQREAIDARAKKLECCLHACFPDRVLPCPQCYIPLIVENVRGAQPWVGRSAWNYGSFHLWGDVPALMPINLKRGIKLGGGRSWTGKNGYGSPDYKPFGFNTENEKALAGQKIPVYSDPRRNGGKAAHLTSPRENEDGLKIGGDWFSDPNSTCRKHGSRSKARKAASAQIAKIPFELSRHIAATYYPRAGKSATV